MKFFAVTIALLSIHLHASTSENFSLGKFASRAIYTKTTAANALRKAPAVILIPGSGEFGPEAMFPKAYPLAGVDGYPLLTLWAGAFQKAGFQTLQLGKPGVEFFKDWQTVIAGENFYDKAMWANLRWIDLIKNVEDAIQFLGQDPSVDPNQIYLLGHSEGTVVASDVAAAHPEIKGVILLGYAGESIGSTLYWQIFTRQADQVISLDIDADHDGVITEREAKPWPAAALFPPTLIEERKSWDWEKHARISLAEISAIWRNDAALQEQADVNFWIKRFPFWVDFAPRNDIKETTASIKGSVHVFTGEFDINTPPEWSMNLKRVCESRGKFCSIEIVPGLTHKMTPVSSAFAGPHFNKVLDQGLNPVSASFLGQLTSFAERLQIRTP
jgi:pimeloyl-ACP methyl ester carboxylesterase